METLTVELDRLRRPTWSAEESARAEAVADFVRLLMNEHDFDAVRDRFGAGVYTQHNHGIADGIDGVIETVSELTKRFPEYTYDVQHIFVDGDTVIFHSHATLRRSHRGNTRKGFNITRPLARRRRRACGTLGFDSTHGSLRTSLCGSDGRPGPQRQWHLRQ